MIELDLIACSSGISNHALDGKKLPNKIKLLNWGKNETTDGDVYLNDKTLSIFEAMQEKSGRDKDVALDFDHCTVPGSDNFKAGEPKSIAAYGQPKLVEGDGLYLEALQWTDLGEKHARNYKDLSPTVVVAKDGTVTGLHSAALTPNGAVKGLKFYSAQGFGDMIKSFGSSPLKEGLVMHESKEPTAKELDYNYRGANAAVKKVGNKYEVHDLDAMDMMNAKDGVTSVPAVQTKSYNSNDETHKEDDEDCMCAKCLEAYNADNKNKISTIKTKKSGISIADGEKQKTKTMSANNYPLPDAYKAQESYYNTMNDSIIKKMAAEVGMDGESDAEKVLFAFLAKYEGMKSEASQLINKHDNTDEGGLKQFSAKIEELENEIKTLKNKESSSERDFLIKQAEKEGKYLSLTANTLKTISMDVLKELITNTPKRVPMQSQLKSFSAKSTLTPEEKKQKAIDAFNAQIA